MRKLYEILLFFEASAAQGHCFEKKKNDSKEEGEARLVAILL